MAFYRMTKGSSSGGPDYSYTCSINNGGSLTPLTSLNNYFISNHTFSDAIVIGNNITDCNHMFYHCYNYNNVVTFGENVRNCVSMFDNCFNLNQSLVLPNNIINCFNMFRGCNNLRAVSGLGDRPIDVSGMFENCYNLDCSFTIYNNFKHVQNMFRNCNNLNSEIFLKIQNCSDLLWGHRNFNNVVHFDENVYFCNGLFGECTSFNCPVTLPASFRSGYEMFYNCTSFSQQKFYIPANAASCANMFEGCTNFTGSVYINGNGQYFSGIGMFYNCNRQLLKSVFCNNIAVLNKTSASTSLVGEDITWTATSHGFYNTYFNIYIFNNYYSML